MWPSWFFWSGICPDWFCVTQINDGTWLCLTARTHICQCVLCSSQWFTLTLLWDSDGFIVEQPLRVGDDSQSPMWMDEIYEIEVSVLWRMPSNPAQCIPLSLMQTQSLLHPESACAYLVEIWKLCFSYCWHDKQAGVGMWVCINKLLEFHPFF